MYHIELSPPPGSLELPSILLARAAGFRLGHGKTRGKPARTENRAFLKEGVFKALPFIFSHIDFSIAGGVGIPPGDFMVCKRLP